MLMTEILLLTAGKIFAMTPEVGSSSDGFWPSQSRIFPLAEENLLPNLYYAWVAGGYVLLENVNFPQQNFLPGEAVQFYPELKNKGLSTAYYVSVELTSLDAFSSISTGSIAIDSIQSRELYTLSAPLSFTVSSGATGEQIKLLVKTKINDVKMSDDTISINVDDVVSVELITFTAKLVDQKVVLNWSTATEHNNYGFEIEKISDPGTDEIRNLKWQTLGFINGKGDIEQISDYSFIDNSPLTGRSYYRLKQINFNGSYKYYDPVAVDYSGVTEYELSQNYPNPFNPVTVIKYSLPEAGIVSLKVYNVLGVEVAELVNEFKDAGKYSVEFSVDLLKGRIGSGVYFYTLKSGNFTQTRKMVVIK